MMSDRPDNNPRPQVGEPPKQFESPFSRVRASMASAPREASPETQRPSQRIEEPTSRATKELMPGIHRNQVARGHSPIQNILVRAYGITFEPEDHPSDKSAGRPPNALPTRGPRVPRRTTSSRPSSSLSNSPRSRPSFGDSSPGPELPAVPASWRRREFVFDSNVLRHPQPSGHDQVASSRKDALGHTVFGEVDKIYWRSYNGLPACLLALKISFHSGTTSGLRKFQNARVQMKFTNQPTSTPSEPVAATAAVARTEPRVYNFCPARIFGRVTTEESESLRAWGWGRAPRAPLANPRYLPSPPQKVVRIMGNKVGHNRVCFEACEDPRRATGIPDTVCYGVLIVHDGLGRLRCHVTANIADRCGTPGGGDDGDEGAIILAPGETWGRDLGAKRLPGRFEEWTDEHWRMVVPCSAERPNIVQGGGI